MSQNNIPNPSPFQPMRQPIHFYATTRNSMHDMYYGMPHISSVVSPTKYFSSKISPIKAHSSTVQNRSPETQFNFERVLNSSYPSKYAKLTAKIQMLQKNLNRLNGQHQSLLQMFERSEQLAKTGEIFATLDQFKERLQQSKRTKHIEQKRYEARHEVVYQDWMKRFDELVGESLKSQKLKIVQVEQRNKLLSKENSKINIYDTLYEYSIQHIDDLKVYTERYLNELNYSLKKEAISMIKKLKVQEKIRDEQAKIQLKKQRVKLKLGELKCMTEYEMFMSKESELNQEINKLKKQFQTGKDNIKEKEKDQKMSILELRFTKDELRFVTVESLDRIMFELASIDSKFVKVIQQFEPKNAKISSKQKHGLNPTKRISSSIKIEDKQNLTQKVQLISDELIKLNYELSGLSKYFSKSMQKIAKIKTDCKIESTQNDQLQNQEFLQSIKELQDKINTLSSNLVFFNSNCNSS